MKKLMSMGEELESLTRKGLADDEAKAVMKVRHEQPHRFLKCHYCGSSNLRFRGKRCRDEYVCRHCGRSDCYYYDGKKFVEGKGWKVKE